MADAIPPQRRPSLAIPPSDSTVRVSILNTTTDILSPASTFVQPPIPGQDYLNMPTFCFLLEHARLGRKLLFDGGARKDWWNLAAVNVSLISSRVPGARVSRNVNEILRAAGVDDAEIDGVVWSHWHWDHVGDISLFPPTTEAVVGPGFKKAFMPGYPTNPTCPLLDSDFDGRTVREIEFDDGLRIGDFRAHDFFGDGSFYLLDTPGGHISGLARTTADTFVFMGGDICHYGGVYRPTAYAPMPATIPESVPRRPRLPTPCPCSIFTACHPNQEVARTSPYYRISDKPGSWYEFPAVAQNSVDSLQVFDADPNVLVCIAHDVGLAPVVTFFPDGSLNDWQAKGWKEATAWGFLNELPVDGEPGTPMLVDKLYREGKAIGGGDEVLQMYL